MLKSKVSDRVKLYSINLSGKKIKLSDLEARGISYVPCTHQTPLVKYAHLWNERRQANLDSYKDTSNWTMSRMQRVQLMTGKPTYRPSKTSPDGYKYLTLLDIEARVIERHPDAFGTIERLLGEACEIEPCAIENKKGGRHYYFFCDLLTAKIAFQDKTDKKMLVEIFNRKGLGRLDDRYSIKEGSILNIPTLPKPTLQAIYRLIAEMADEIKHPDAVPVVEKSNLNSNEILWREDGRSQYFALSYCRATTHHDQNRKAVQFFKRHGGIKGYCYNCGQSWYEQAPTRKHTLDPTPVPPPTQTWKDQQATLEQAFDSDKDTVLIRADTGVGKDYAKTTHILGADIDAEKFVEMTTRVNLADEKIDSFKQRNTGGIRAMRWKPVFHNWNTYRDKPFHERKRYSARKTG